MYDQVNAIRKSKGFLSVEQTLLLTEQGNTVLDPFSVLISESANIGDNNLFYPNVIIQSDHSSEITIGSGNVFYPQTLMIAEAGGGVTIGNNNQFGDNGCSVKANLASSVIEIADNGRYLNGCQIMGQSSLGSGCQILGPITVQSCVLDAGDDFTGNQPDDRAALLKGSGLAREVRVARGYVIHGSGVFDQNTAVLQSSYH